jgi:peptidyl-tRNA hydrolase
MDHLHTDKFYRLRIGIGRPDNNNYDVSDYVLSSPMEDEFRQIQKAISNGLGVLPKIFSGEIEQAIKLLHT